MVFDLPRVFVDVRRNQITEDAISTSDIPEGRAVCGKTASTDSVRGGGQQWLFLLRQVVLLDGRTRRPLNERQKSRLNLSLRELLQTKNLSLEQKMCQTAQNMVYKTPGKKSVESRDQRRGAAPLAGTVGSVDVPEQSFVFRILPRNIPAGSVSLP